MFRNVAPAVTAPPATKAGVNYVPTGRFITPIAKVPEKLVLMDRGVNYVSTGSFIAPIAKVPPRP